MSTIKISQLPVLPTLSANTAGNLFLAVDSANSRDVQITGTTLAQGLYSNNILNVGANPVNFSNTVSQFSGYDPVFLQANFQNFNANGSIDVVLTADTGTNQSNYVDLGINNSQWNNAGYTAMYPLDGYLYVQDGGASGGNLMIGTASSNTSVSVIVGGTNSSNVVAKFTTSGLLLTPNSSITFPDGTKQSTAASPASYSQAAFSLANTALQNTSTIVVNNLNVLGNTTFSGNTLHYGNLYITGNIVTTGPMTTYGPVQTVGNLFANGTTIFTGPFTNNGLTINNGNTINNGYTTLNGVLSVNGSIIPANSNISLGSAANPFQNIYTNNSTISFANSNLTISGTFTANGPSIINGNLTSNGSITMANGIIQINNNVFSANQSALQIIGSNGAVYVTPPSDGHMLQITGKDGIPNRTIHDSFGTGAYSVVAGRAGRGTASSPSPSQAGDIIARFTSSAYTPAGFNPLGTGRIEFQALDTMSNTAQGTQINFATIPVGSNVLSTMTSFASNVISILANTTLNVSNVIQYNASVNNGTVTQLTNKANAVTCNGRTGQITTSNANINKGSVVTFTVNNSYVVSAKDVVIVNIASGASVGYALTVTNVTPGSFNITVNNCDGTPSGSNAADTLVINYAIIRVA